jgi:endonuclease-3
MVLLDAPHIELLFERLSAANPQPVTELMSRNTYTLLVAVVLSAQMTDKGVNKISGALFDAADTPGKMLSLGEEGLREYIKSINLFPTKAKRIIALSRILVDEFGGEVPSARESLEKLPGVGRKTANVMLNVAFGEPTLAVDTHILRIAPRTGLSSSVKPLQVERDLLKIIPERFRREAHHWLLLHGRYVCIARKPCCADCCLEDFCPKNGVEKGAI